MIDSFKVETPAGGGFDPYTDISWAIAADLDDFNGTTCANSGSAADLAINGGTPTAGTGNTAFTEADSLTLPITATTNTYEFWFDVEISQSDSAAFHDMLLTAHESYHNTGGAVRVGIGGASFTTTGTLSLNTRYMMRISWSGASGTLEIRQKNGTVMQAATAWTTVNNSPSASGWFGKFDGLGYQIFKKESTLLSAGDISDMWTWWLAL